jgi:hypothetical protein
MSTQPLSRSEEPKRIMVSDVVKEYASLRGTFFRDLNIQAITSEEFSTAISIARSRRLELQRKLAESTESTTQDIGRSNSIFDAKSFVYSKIEQGLDSALMSWGNDLLGMVHADDIDDTKELLTRAFRHTDTLNQTILVDGKETSQHILGHLINSIFLFYFTKKQLPSNEDLIDQISNNISVILEEILSLINSGLITHSFIEGIILYIKEMYKKQAGRDLLVDITDEYSVANALFVGMSLLTYFIASQVSREI